MKKSKLVLVEHILYLRIGQKAGYFSIPIVLVGKTNLELA
jgi:hypothetical protein